MIFLYFLRSKDELFLALKDFIGDTKPIGNIMELHTDNGGEYQNSRTQTILREHSIKHTTTAPYSPYQNGKSERTWRSTMEMARRLPTDAELDKTYWTYAIRHTQYLRNRSYLRRTGKTLYEMFTDEKPDMRKINAFGAQCTYYNELHKNKLTPEDYQDTT
jgi:transposase InsO family protein